jgi:hypothetical protein
MLKRTRKNSRKINFSRHRLAVKFLFSLIFGAILFGLITIYIVPNLSSVKPSNVKPSKTAARASYNDLGINDGTGYNTDPAFVDRAISHLKKLGLGMVRTGMDGVGGMTEGAAFDWSARDLAVDKQLKAGIKIHMVVSARIHVERGDNYEQWKANFRYLVYNVMAHYKGKVFYYIVDNEPDMDFGRGLMTAQECLDMTRIAYEAARATDPKIKIESPPPKAPYSDIFGEMLDLGIDKVSDYIGMHVYGGQIQDQYIEMPWKALEERGIRKPIAISESGAINDYCPGSKAEKDNCRRRWFALFGQQFKRYGYDHALLFDLEGHDQWAIAPGFKPTPAYWQIKNLRLNRKFSNGDFESANNNPETDWVHFNPGDVGDMKPTPYVTFVRNDAKGAHRGRSYLRLESGKADSGTPISVRRIAGQLPQGQNVKIGAWVYVKGGTAATLKVRGYDYLDGNAQISKTSTKQNSWEYLEVTVPISRYWTVVELTTSGTRKKGDCVKWDDVTVRTS